MSTRIDLAVLGAGPAGLWAARAAAAAGTSTVVLERAAAVGGLAGSFTVAGVRVDHGSHRLHAATDASVLRELDRLLGGDLQVRPRRGRIRLAGRWIGFPLRPLDVARRLPPGFAVRALGDAVTAPLRHPVEDSFAEEVRVRLGPTMLDRFYGPYARKLWGLGPEALSGEQARRRIGAGSAAGMLSKVVRGADPAARTFRYPRGGFGQLWEAVAADGVRNGVDLRLGTPATGLTPAADGIAVDTPDGSFTARRVWSTIPAAALPRLWRAAVPGEVAAAAARLVSRAMVLVYLVVGGRPYTSYDAHYLPESWTPVTRISEPTNYRWSDEDPPDRTVLCAEVPCQVGDDLWRMDERACGRMVVDALRRAELPRPHIREVHVRRVPAAYPILDHGATARLEVVERWVGGLRGVLTFGRQGLFTHDNTHHAIAMADAAVGSLAGDEFDDDEWARRRKGFRAHVVED